MPACSGSSLSDGGGDQDLETPYGKLSGRPMIQEVVGTIEANRLLESGAWSVSHVFNRGEDLVYVLGRRAKYPDPETASQGLRTFYERKKRDLDQAMVRPSESPHQAQPSHP